MPLCDLWAYLHCEVLSGGAWCDVPLALGRLRLRQLAAALVAVLAAPFGGHVEEFRAQRPIPLGLVYET